jgi:hypothetical protein
MLSTPAATAVSLYVSSFLVLGAAFGIRSDPREEPLRPLERAHLRGEVEPGIPRLEPGDPMANEAVLMEALSEVENPGCEAGRRTIALAVGGRLSRVRFSPRTVCQLARLKQISVAQPGFGHHGIAEVAAFVLGHRHGEVVEVTRIVVPPFRFTGQTITFLAADLGALDKGEQLIGTYHTHPDDDWRQGVLSEVDLSFMDAGYVDFHGQVGFLHDPDGRDTDWLFDIVETRDGGWNVYAHDRPLLDALYDKCVSGPRCPVDALRVPGTGFYLLTRYYEDKPL